MMNNPLISVIIPTYNRAYYIERSINSVAQQTYKNWEIIIIDDGSTDETYKVITPYLKDSRIKYNYHNNCGVSKSINKGFELANGEFISILNDDDEFMENKLNIQLSEMLKHNAEFSFTNGIKVYDGKKNNQNKFSHSYIINSRDFFNQKFHLSCSYMMLKSSIKEECKFDTSLFASIDFDLLLRIINKFKVLYVSQPLAYIHKSLNRKRISNTPKLKITTFEQLIKKIETYDCTAQEKERLKRSLLTGIGFWKLLNAEYKSGRQNIQIVFNRLAFNKKIKFGLLYILSFFPPIFELTKKIAENLWSLSSGRVKV